MATPLFQLDHITKTFPGVVANDDVSLALEEASIHAVIGENGAGKSTLMGVLYGRYQPDSGRISHRGAEVNIPNPAAAIALGIGMVTQHTTMIPALTALENVILGNEPVRPAGTLSRAGARARIAELAGTLGIVVDWQAPAEQLSVAALQKAEIVKALYRGARLLILDEPTATLAPQEATSLFALMHQLVADGVTVVLVTHKLREVMEHSNAVTVLRGGKVTGERPTAETNPEELLALMLGQGGARAGSSLVELESPPGHGRRTDSEEKPALEVAGLTVLNDRRAPAVRDVSLRVMPGEVVGIAGVDGSGQRELAQAIVGLRAASSGRVLLNGRDATRLSVAKRQADGLAYVPEDRHREGLVLEFSLAENMLLGKQRLAAFGGGPVLNLNLIRAEGEAAIRKHRIRAGSGETAAATLSGGNQQKVVVARALESRPRLLVAMQPTRGLDVEATRYIYSQFERALADGMGILLFSLDMDEIMAISDRIAVIFDGRIVADLPRQGTTADAVGRLMVEGRT